MKWRLAVTPRVQEALPHLPPSRKRYVREAFEEISKNPWIGKPLRDELTGLRSFRVGRFRIVYQLQQDARTVMVAGVGPREAIYQQLAAELR